MMSLRKTCHCSRRHFATSSRVRAAPFSPRSERTATRQPCGRSGARPLNYTASLATCPRRHAPTMKIGMITDSLPDADFDTMLGGRCAARDGHARVRVRQLVERAAYRARSPARKRDRAPRFPRPARRRTASGSARSTAPAIRVHPGEAGRRHDEVTRKTIRLAGPARRRSRRDDVGMPRRARRQPRELDHDRMAARGARDPALAMGRRADPLLARPRRLRPRPGRAHASVSSCTATRTSTASRRSSGCAMPSAKRSAPISIPAISCGWAPIRSRRRVRSATPSTTCTRRTRGSIPSIAGVNGVIDTTPGSDFQARAWNYITLGLRPRRRLVARVRRGARGRRLRRRAVDRARGSGDERRGRRREVGRAPAPRAS